MNYLISFSNIVELYWNLINSISLVREGFGPRGFLSYFFSRKRPEGLFPTSFYYNEAQQNYWKYFMNDWFFSSQETFCVYKNPLRKTMVLIFCIIENTDWLIGRLLGRISRSIYIYIYIYIYGPHNIQAHAVKWVDA